MSHHCHDEHGDDGHGHHDGHDNGSHDHSDDISPALQFSLYQQIDFAAIDTLNEADFGSGAAIVKKPWTERLTPTPELASDADAQLLVSVPFTAQVKLHAILLRAAPDDSAPRTLRVFVNRDDVDFAAAEELEPTQELELAQTADVQELAVRRARFGGVRKLTLFFADNFGSEAGDDDEVTRISYLGFRGEWMQLGRAPASILYEAAANPADHALKGTSVNQMGSGIGGRGPGV